MVRIDGEFFPCMVSGELIPLRRVAGDFATDEKGRIYRYLAGELNEARRVTNFNPSEANSFDNINEYITHRLKESKKGNRLRIYSIEDFMEYIEAKSAYPSSRRRC